MLAAHHEEVNLEHLESPALHAAMEENLVRAMAISTFGPPEVLQMIALDDPQAGPGQVRVRANDPDVAERLHALGHEVVHAAARLGRPAIAPSMA